MRKVIETYVSGNITVGGNYEADVSTKAFPIKGRSLVDISKGKTVEVKKVDKEQVIFIYNKKECVMDMEDFKRGFVRKV